MLLKELIDKGRAAVADAYPDEEAREIVHRLLEDLIGVKRHTHITEPFYEVSDAEADAAAVAFGRIAAGEPLQYVTGTSDFYGRRFLVSPSVLVPRPETEYMCRIASEHCRGLGKPLRILDLCTGSGCIAWTMALEFPGSEVTAVDISEDALSVASSQPFIKETACTGALQPQFIKADVLQDPPHSIEGTFNLILGNPPYVMESEKAQMRSNVLDHEPHLALFVPDEDPLMFYRAVARWASLILSPEGIGIVEINESLGKETSCVFRDAGFLHTGILKDLADRDRFIIFSRQII